MQQLQCSTLQHATVSHVGARRPWAADGYQYTLPATAGTAVSSRHAKEVQR
jgi:hypothetical protein